MALIFLLLPPLLSSLVPVGDELARPRERAEALVFDLVSYAEAPLHTWFVVASAFWSCSCCEGFGTIWALIGGVGLQSWCFSRGHNAIWASNGGWWSFSWALSSLVSGLLCCCLWPCWSSCASVEHGWCRVAPDDVFSCGGMLWAFVRYPPATSNTGCLLPNLDHLTPHGGCTTSGGWCVQPQRGPRRAARAAGFTSLHTIPPGLLFLRRLQLPFFT